MKTVLFHPDAESEMNSAEAWYEAQLPDLGKRFRVSVKDAINRIILNPSLYPIVYLDVRRCLIQRFPFGVLFRELADRIIIVSVMHLHRDPDYWKTR